MATNTQPEFWLRGPVEGIPAALMPAAHAFLQTLEDVEGATADLSEEQLWARPGGVASIGFHLIHLSGSTDRLLTYARGERLNDVQKAAARAESDPPRVGPGSLLAESTAIVRCGAVAAARDRSLIASGRATRWPGRAADDGPRAALSRRRTLPATRGASGNDGQNRAKSWLIDWGLTPL